MKLYDFAHLCIHDNVNIKVRDLTGELVANVTAYEVIVADEEDWDYEVVGVGISAENEFLVVIEGL